MAMDLSTTGYVQVGADTRLDASPFTISAWIKTTQATANIAFLNRHGTPSSNRGFTTLMNGTAGKISLGAKDSGGTYRVSGIVSTTTVNDDVWRHLAVVYNYSTAANGNKIYIDGSLEAQGASTAAWDVLTSANFRIGLSVDSFWGDYGDYFAEVAWYDAELSADEIVSLAKGFRPNKVRPQNLVTYERLIRGADDLKGLTITTANITGWVEHPRVF